MNVLIQKTRQYGFMLGLLIAFCLQAVAADLVARINTDTVVEGDSFQLILASDGDAAPPSLTPLKADFAVLGTSQNTRINMINGQISRSSEWIITLSPKKVGALTIPAIEAGQARSQPLSITVVDAAKAPKTQGAAQGIAVTARINGSGDQFYPFQEIQLTVRIETDQPFQQATLIAPQIAGVELTQQGQDRHSQLTQNGQPISIIERDYVLRPQNPGEIKVPPFVLKGSVPDGRNRDPFADFDDFFGSPSPFAGRFGRGKAFVARSNTLNITVQGQPESADGEWFLPAKAVTLNAEWQPQKPSFKVGEAVTRTIYLNALGARAEQLPKLTFTSVPGAKIYVDKDETVMRQTTDGTEAQRQVTLSIVPTQGGEVVLPAVSVKWFNTQSKETVTSVLPAETIQVSGPSPAAKAATKNANAQAPTTPVSAPNDTPEKSSEAMSFPLLWWLIGAGLLLLLAVLIGWLRWRRRNRQSDEAAKNTSVTPVDSEPLTDIKTQLQSAITAKHPQALYQAILNWQRHSQAARQSSALAAIKTQLEQALYQANPQAKIDIEVLGKALLIQWHKLNHKEKTDNNILPPLYRRAEKK